MNKFKPPTFTPTFIMPGHYINGYLMQIKFSLMIKYLLVGIENELFSTFGEKAFWGCTSLSKIYYYGNKEPSWNTGTNCINNNLGCSSVNCAPFYCQTNSITVYVRADYSGSSTTFCGKSVTFSKTLS